MSIGRVVKIAFSPLVGTTTLLGIVVATTLLQFLVIEHETLPQAAFYAIGYVAFTLSLKLILGAVFGLFVNQASGVSPRGSMLLLALILMIGGMFLLMPLLSEYAV